MDNEKKSLFSVKEKVLGKWVAIMDHERSDRSLQLSQLRTRCIGKNEIHEFIICDPVNDYSTIDHVVYLGFGEITSGGVIEIGDLFYSDMELIGPILGFDDTHYPNHYNIVISSKNLLTGAKLGLSLNSNFSIGKSL